MALRSRAHHFDDYSIKACGLNFNDVFVIALRENLDLTVKALEALVLTELGGSACLYLENLDGDFPLRFQIISQLDSTRTRIAKIRMSKNLK